MSFDFINIPLAWVLKMCSQLVGNNYLLAILVFSLLFEILLLPFAIKQQKNSIKQARLRPKEMAIRKKYAGRDDKPTQQKMTQEIQELYQQEGYNPMSGCLPLLVQFPLLIALYYIVIDPLKYICGFSADAIQEISLLVKGSTETPRGTMELLEGMKAMGPKAFEAVRGFSEEAFNAIPNLNLFGINFGISPSECMNLAALKTVEGWVIILIPVLTFVSYFFSMKMTRKFTYQPMNDAQQAQMGCSNKVMDIAMPLFSVFISFGVPAALGIYWIFKSLIGVVKQFAIAKAMPLPKYTEEELKAAEKEIANQTEKKSNTVKSGKVVRSLHHIDDEDFADTAEAARRRREALEAQEKAEQEEKKAALGKKKNLFQGAVMKKDDRADQKDEPVKATEENNEEKTEDSNE